MENATYEYYNVILFSSFEGVDVAKAMYVAVPLVYLSTPQKEFQSIKLSNAVPMHLALVLSILLSWISDLSMINNQRERVCGTISKIIIIYIIVETSSLE